MIAAVKIALDLKKSMSIFCLPPASMKIEENCKSKIKLMLADQTNFHYYLSKILIFHENSSIQLEILLFIETLKFKRKGRTEYGRFV